MWESAIFSHNFCFEKKSLLFAHKAAHEYAHVPTTYISTKMNLIHIFIINYETKKTGEEKKLFKCLSVSQKNTDKDFTMYTLVLICCLWPRNIFMDTGAR